MVALSDTWTKFTSHAEQQRFWRCNRRFIGVDAGRGTGKTAIAKRKLVAQQLWKPRENCPNPWYFYAAPTYEQARRVAWEDFLALIPSNWIAPDGVDRSRLTIRTIFGSTLFVRGLDKPERTEGSQWCGGIVDESCDIKRGAIPRSILPTLIWNNGFLWRIGVPKRRGPSAMDFRRFCENHRDGHQTDTISFTWPASEILPPEVVDAARDQMDLPDFLEQMEARWQTAGGGIYHAFDEEESVRPCSYNPSLPICVGSDFNVNPMAWVISHVYEDDAVAANTHDRTGVTHVEVFDEIWVRDCNTPRALNILLGRFGHHTAGFKFYGDATGRARKTSASRSDYQHIEFNAAFHALGRRVFYPRSNPAIADRFATTNAMLQSAAGVRRLHIDPRCKHLAEDLKLRAYKEGSNEPDDTSDVGHISDALGYLVHWVGPLRSGVVDTTPAPVFATAGQ